MDLVPNGPIPKGQSRPIVWRVYTRKNKKGRELHSKKKKRRGRERILTWQLMGEACELFLRILLLGNWGMRERVFGRIKKLVMGIRPMWELGSVAVGISFHYIFPISIIQSYF